MQSLKALYFLLAYAAAIRDDLLPPCRNYTIDGVFRLEACWKRDFIIEPIPPKFTLSYEDATNYKDFLDRCYFQLNELDDPCARISNLSSIDCPVFATAAGELGGICFTSNMSFVGAHFLDNVFLLSESALKQLSNALEEYVAWYKIAKLDGPWIANTRQRRESNILRSCYSQCNRRNSIP
jgi:hypothetical protein